eukprot:29810_5
MERKLVHLPRERKVGNPKAKRRESKSPLKTEMMKSLKRTSNFCLWTKRNRTRAENRLTSKSWTARRNQPKRSSKKLESLWSQIHSRSMSTTIASGLFSHHTILPSTRLTQAINQHLAKLSCKRNRNAERQRDSKVSR